MSCQRKFSMYEASARFSSLSWADSAHAQVCALRAMVRHTRLGARNIPWWYLPCANQVRLHSHTVLLSMFENCFALLSCQAEFIWHWHSHIISFLYIHRYMHATFGSFLQDFQESLTTRMFYCTVIGTVGWITQIKSILQDMKLIKVDESYGFPHISTCFHMF